MSGVIDTIAVSAASAKLRRGRTEHYARGATQAYSNAPHLGHRPWRSSFGTEKGLAMPHQVDKALRNIPFGARNEDVSSVVALVGIVLTHCAAIDCIVPVDIIDLDQLYRFLREDEKSIHAVIHDRPVHPERNVPLSPEA